MAVKSYAGKIKSNWAELSPQRQAELVDIWNDHEADCALRQIKKSPEAQQAALFDAVVEYCSTNLS